MNLTHVPRYLSAGFLTLMLLVGSTASEAQLKPPITGGGVSFDPRRAATSEERVKAEYERIKAGLGDKEYRVAHIMTRDRAEAEEILGQLKAGKSFADLASRSIDPASRERGGDLGWLSPNLYEREFAAAIKALPVGAYSDPPVQTAFGWHVLTVIETRPLRVRSFSEVEDALRAKLRRSPYPEGLSDEDVRIVQLPYVIDRVRDAIRDGKDLNQRFPGGGTLLMSAVAYDDIEAVKLLLQHRANPNLADSDGRLPIEMAAFFGNPAIVDMLLEYHRKAPRTLSSAPTVVKAAVLGGNLEIVSKVIAAGANVNGANPKDGITPLMLAAGAGRLDIVRRLLAAGANPLAVDAGLQGYRSALDYAWLEEREEVLALLEEAAQAKVMAAGKKKHLQVFVEQGGKRWPAAGTVTLERAPFSLLFEIEGERRVYVNASLKDSLLTRARMGNIAGTALTQTPKVGAQEANSDHSLFVSDDTIQCWLDAGEFHRFDTVKDRNGRFFASRTISSATVFVPGEDLDSAKPIQALPGRDLYLVFAVNQRLGALIMVPAATSYLHIVWKTPESTAANDAAIGGERSRVESP